ncbi:hypothetical protein Tco_0924293 [Tanacetum coccineum]|uniref:Uncharacterized protein n=1 Tax=Tanacetum coccineum TaxID=301880 RepID=A0ABQ5D4I2_9ASTR
MLVSFILLGKYLESKAKGKTSDALAKLIDLAPDTACLLTMNDERNALSETWWLKGPGIQEKQHLLLKSGDKV